MVLQETWLKLRNGRENICYGKPDATEEEMIMAAKEANTYVYQSECQMVMIRHYYEGGGNLSPRTKRSSFVLPARIMLKAFLNADLR